MSSRSASLTAWFVGGAVVYGAAVQVGLELTEKATAPIALFWPAAGVGVALIVLGLRQGMAGGCRCRIGRCSGESGAESGCGAAAR